MEYVIKLINEDSSKSLDLTKFLEEKSEVVIGRGENCDVRLLNEFVSRRHCSITYHQPSSYCVLPDFINRKYLLSIRDLNSLNGTIINNSRILDDKPITLGEGDHIGIGGIEYYVNISNKVSYDSKTKEIK
ncbi:MAG: FHA domain-containing protein [Candidatus Pacearchaeota archaeon]|jgi:pSer/pThr/pTyr-binding forkhead associated (FHA) protein